MKAFFFFLFFIISISSLDAQNHKIQKYVFGSSSALSQNQSHKFFSTVGQAAIGTYENNKIKHSAGFWAGISLPTSVDESVLLKEENISISPNPASDYIEIALNRLSKTSRLGKSELKIYNSLGKCVMSKSIHTRTPSHRMNIENLPVGLYFIKIGNNSDKFMVVR